MRYFTKPLFAVGVALAVMSPLILSGCPTGSDLERPGDFLSEGEGCDALPIFERCAGSICHSGEDALGTVDLLSPGVEGRLVGVPASYANVDDAADCPTENPELLVDPNDIEASLMLTKLLGTHACGDGMPVPNPPGLNDAEVDCVRKWIQGLVAAGTGGAPGSGGGTASGGADQAGLGGAQ